MRLMERCSSLNMELSVPVENGEQTLRCGQPVRRVFARLGYGRRGDPIFSRSLVVANLACFDSGTGNEFVSVDWAETDDVRGLHHESAAHTLSTARFDPVAWSHHHGSTSGEGVRRQCQMQVGSPYRLQGQCAQPISPCVRHLSTSSSF